MRLLVIPMLLLAGFISFAQDNNFDSYFSIKLGVNTVDSSGEQKLFNVFSDADRMAFTSPFALGADYRFSRLFSAGLFASINKWKAGDNLDGVTLSSGQEVDYFSADLSLKLYIDELLFGNTNDAQNGWLDLYVGIGGAYFSETDSGLSGNLSTGANIWVTDNLGLNLEAIAKFSEEEYTSSNHFQYFAGLTYRFSDNDADNDGIKDDKDDCPNTLGLAEFNGCPDTDADGVMDKDDNCPNEAGAINGCPDSDNDGIVDTEDNCATVSGPAANNGCPWPDADGDGILDKDDNCPNQAGADNGCPEAEPETTEKVISDTVKADIFKTSQNINFGINKNYFTEASAVYLKQIIGILQEYPGTSLHIIGHTDAIAFEKYNKKLSIERANTVKDYLLQNGLSGYAITVEGLGETKPIASNFTVEGRAKNRRVEIYTAIQKN